jgi:type 1 glutamine amidotransferase
MPVAGLGLLALGAGSSAAAPAKTNAIPVLLIDGQAAGPYHDWALVTQVLKKELEVAGIFEVTVATSPRSNEDFSNFHPDFSKYKVVVMNYDGPDWPESLRTPFEQFVKNGGGLVVVHAADNAFPQWPAWNQMTGVGGWRGRTEAAGPRWFYQDGKIASDNSAGPAGSHGARLPFQVTARARNHPILKGLPPVWMHNSDELYAALRGPGEHMAVLATAHSDPANHGSGRDEPVLMALDYGKGRIFHTTLGHDVTALSCAGFMATLQRGAEWAATGRVTQKAPRDFPTADSVSFRVDIARMDPVFLRGPSSAGSFDNFASGALEAMRKRAEQLGIGGVAVVAYFEGEQVHGWQSRMLVVGRMRDEPTADSKGNNLLAFASQKAAEMADTLKNSGTQPAPLLNGELGWQGGVIARGRNGYLIAAFSGGKSEDDVQVSQAGIAALQAGL